MQLGEGRVVGDKEQESWQLKVGMVMGDLARAWRSRKEEVVSRLSGREEEGDIKAKEEEDIKVKEEAKEKMLQNFRQFLKEECILHIRSMAFKILAIFLNRNLINPSELAEDYVFRGLCSLLTSGQVLIQEESSCSSYLAMPLFFSEGALLPPQEEPALAALAATQALVRTLGDRGARWSISLVYNGLQVLYHSIFCFYPL